MNKRVYKVGDRVLVVGPKNREEWPQNAISDIGKIGIIKCMWANSADVFIEDCGSGLGFWHLQLIHIGPVLSEQLMLFEL